MIAGNSLWYSLIINDKWWWMKHGGSTLESANVWYSVALHPRHKSHPMRLEPPLSSLHWVLDLKTATVGVECETVHCQTECFYNTFAQSVHRQRREQKNRMEWKKIKDFTLDFPHRKAPCKAEKPLQAAWTNSKSFASAQNAIWFHIPQYLVPSLTYVQFWSVHLEFGNAETRKKSNWHSGRIGKVIDGIILIDWLILITN